MTGGLYALLCAAAIIGAYKLGKTVGEMDRMFELWRLRDELQNALEEAEECAAENSDLRTLLNMEDDLNAH